MQSQGLEGCEILLGTFCHFIHDSSRAKRKDDEGLGEVRFPSFSPGSFLLTIKLENTGNDCSQDRLQFSDQFQVRGGVSSGWMFLPINQKLFVYQVLPLRFRYCKQRNMQLRP
jgi:hypothetical protein